MFSRSLNKFAFKTMSSVKGSPGLPKMGILSSLVTAGGLLALSSEVRTFCKTSDLGSDAEGLSIPSRTIQGKPEPDQRLYQMLEHNRQFVEAEKYKHIERLPDSINGPAKRIVVISCMDTRLTYLLPQALGVKPGQAKIIKSAGAIVSSPFGGIMRSVIVALYALNADAVYVIGHKDCGMNALSTPSLIYRMMSPSGGNIHPETIQTLANAGIDIHKFLKGFDSLTDSVRGSCSLIRNHPLVPRWVPVNGLIIDPETGKLDLVVDGNKDPLLEPRPVVPENKTN